VQRRFLTSVNVWDHVVRMGVVGLLIGGCGQASADTDSAETLAPISFVGQPVVAGVPGTVPNNRGTDVVEVIFQTSRKLTGNGDGKVAANGVPNVTLGGPDSHTMVRYGPDSTCYKANIFLWGSHAKQAALQDARPGDAVTVTLNAQPGRPPLTATVTGYARLTPSALHHLARETHCPPPRAIDTHPLVSVRSRASTRRAHLRCYGDDADGLRGILDCTMSQHPAGRLVIHPGEHIQISGARKAPGLELTAPYVHKPQFTRLLRRLQPHRVPGTRSTWQARIPRHLRIKPTILEILVSSLPRGYFAHYGITTRLTDP